MFELTIATDPMGLPSVADVAALYRRRHYRSSRRNVCLLTLNHSLNGLNILNILNGFGGW